ncbi:hypothetical protein Tco_0127404 [Tanacetum coccineum]
MGVRCCFEEDKKNFFGFVLKEVSRLGSLFLEVERRRDDALSSQSDEGSFYADIGKDKSKSGIGIRALLGYNVEEQKATTGMSSSKEEGHKDLDAQVILEGGLVEVPLGGCAFKERFDRPYKSPGPDGFTFGFYRRYWDIMEKDVVDAVSFFFTEGLKQVILYLLFFYFSMESLHLSISKNVVDEGLLKLNIVTEFSMLIKIKGDMTFKSRFPRVYALESDKKITVADKMNHNVLGFSLRRAPRDGVEMEQFRDMIAILEVALAEKVIDDHRLSGFHIMTRLLRWFYKSKCSGGGSQGLLNDFEDIEAHSAIVDYGGRAASYGSSLPKPIKRDVKSYKDEVAGEPVAGLNPSQEELMLAGRLLPEMTLCRGNIGTFRLGHRSSYFAFLGTNYQASATAFLRAPSLISVALLVRAAIPSLVRMLPELVRQHQVSRWLFHQTWLCSPYCSIMGDISYAVFVDSHRIPSSLLFLCGFLYRDPAGMAAQKPYSSTGAGLVLRGSNSKWYQGDVVVPSVFFMEGSIIQDILERRIDKCDEEMEIPEKSTNKSNMAMNVSVLSGPYLLMTDLHSQLMTLNDLRTLGGQACLRLGCFAVAWGIMVRRDRRAPHTAMPTAAFESIFG